MEYLQVGGRATRPEPKPNGRPRKDANRVRLTVRVDGELARWAESHAASLTAERGGAVKQGGAGVVALADVVETALKHYRRAVGLKRVTA